MTEWHLLWWRLAVRDKMCVYSRSSVRSCGLQVVSVDKWVIRDRQRGDRRVVYYQPPGTDQDFVLCLTSPFFLAAAARFGHGRAVLMDATFGMCKHKVHSCVHMAGMLTCHNLLHIARCI